MSDARQLASNGVMHVLMIVDRITYTLLLWRVSKGSLVFRFVITFAVGRPYLICCRRGLPLRDHNFVHRNRIEVILIPL